VRTAGTARPDTPLQARIVTAMSDLHAVAHVAIAGAQILRRRSVQVVPRNDVGEHPMGELRVKFLDRTIQFRFWNRVLAQEPLAISSK
jgi:hypothetical protein